MKRIARRGVLPVFLVLLQKKKGFVAGSHWLTFYYTANHEGTRLLLLALQASVISAPNGLPHDHKLLLFLPPSLKRPGFHPLPSALAPGRIPGRTVPGARHDRSSLRACHLLAARLLRQTRRAAPAPWRHLQHLQPWSPVAFVASPCCNVPRRTPQRALPYAHHIPAAATALCAIPTLHTLPGDVPHRRALAQHALHPFDSAQRIRPTDNGPSARAAGPALRAAPGSEIRHVLRLRGVLQRMYMECEETPERALAAIAGARAHVADSSNAISGDFSIVCSSTYDFSCVSFVYRSI
ncbi:hypothetical protein C8F04DRAFT_1129804 [Mycena alexandri]|uniref:Uncharacterized protein n=1 Tax=Mycena alexandri TaxID=1745969 RepID=A0AAD6SBY1_9AGAR|nr:hypothetical protein C8F04DRAFT_1129804 [Mycena alexandri]